MTTRTSSGVMGRWGRRIVTNTDRESQDGQPSFSQAARASPAGAGSGSRSVRLPLPVTVISPARQSMSPSWSPAASAPRRPSRASSDRIA